MSAFGNLLPLGEIHWPSRKSAVVEEHKEGVNPVLCPHCGQKMDAEEQVRGECIRCEDTQN